MAKPLYKRVLGRFFMHAVLILGSLIFAAPFLWLVSTSAKTPEELYPPTWLPILPDRVTESPYIRLRNNERPVRPLGVADEDWQRLQPVFLSTISRHIAALRSQLPEYMAEYVEHPELSEAMFSRLLRRVPVELFASSPEKGKEWFIERIEAAEVQEVFDLIYCCVAFSELTFISWDMRIESPVSPEQIPWRVIAGDVALTTRTEPGHRFSQELAYSFKDHNQFVMQAELPLDWSLEEFKKMRLANHADRSWHTFHAVL
ncbi:MAG: hypothetical protein KAH38_02665, partial [Candidatus Hydrogenedentes bacterium]|nr:hypothetical protein [Candidatus Hydrogenedentota bacterium]